MGKRIGLLLLALASTFLSTSALAEPTGTQVKILSLRPYNTPTGGNIYVETSAPSPCETTGYVIDLSWVGAKEAYAAALSALLADKYVRVEVANGTGCAGWGTKIQSIIIIK